LIHFYKRRVFEDDGKTLQEQIENFILNFTLYI